MARRKKRGKGRNVGRKGGIAQPEEGGKKNDVTGRKKNLL